MLLLTVQSGKSLCRDLTRDLNEMRESTSRVSAGSVFLAPQQQMQRPWGGGELGMVHN